MHKMLDKLMEKKGKSKMSDEYKDAKKSMLMELMKNMDGMSAEPLKSLKKVTVAAPDKEGLEKGLDKAKELMGESEEDSEHEMSESPEMEASEQEMDSEDEDMSLEEIEAQMKQLEEMKKAKLGGK